MLVSGRATSIYLYYQQDIQPGLGTIEVNPAVVNEVDFPCIFAEWKDKTPNSCDCNIPQQVSEVQEQEHDNEYPRPVVSSGFCKSGSLIFSITQAFKTCRFLPKSYPLFQHSISMCQVEQRFSNVSIRHCHR